MFTSTPGQFTHRDVSCFCKYPDECDCHGPKHHICIPAARISTAITEDDAHCNNTQASENKPETFIVQSNIATTFQKLSCFSQASFFFHLAIAC